MFDIVDWTVSRNVHTHFVAHTRKSGRDQGSPESEDIKGGMEIGANAFNIISIWRNKQLEAEIEVAKAQGEEPSDQSTVILNVAKQRNGDWEGKCGLWFCKESYQYRSAHDDSRWRRNYVNTAEQNQQLGEAS
jgi:twinkle protein